ncbi:MAG: amino acid adenylation domain-containing protein, partial [Desulfobacterales bacterium]|nr:amino acid adenylation domain-containing protein [Desulfobacterales bacterium]
DSQAPALLTLEKNMRRLSGRGARVICLDREREAIEKQPVSAPARRCGPDHPAYVIYTSGSTGRPKGVLVEHRGVANLAMAQTRALSVSERSRVLQFAPIGFDAAVWEAVMALCNGASLHWGAGEKPLPDAGLVDLLKRRRITHITLPPSILEVLPRSELPDLETLIVAGEACPPGLAAAWALNRRFYNAYGPTEASVCATIASCGDDGTKPSIGRPIANTRIHILDAHLQQAPIGVPGEICIGGAGLARGYLNRPGLTAERFIPDPFSHEPGARLYKTGDLGRWLPDGAIDYLGRADHQVKLRGHRIELGEIEACIGRHPAVREAVVALREEGDRARLIAWYTTKESASPGGADEQARMAELRGRLRDELPDYMIPSAFARLEAIPLTPNGKIDRKALPVPEERGIIGSSRGVARDLTELRLLRIWEKTLKLHPIGLDENFFDLGGHSILAVRLMSHIQQDFGWSPPLSALFQAPTISQLAE